MRFALLVIVFLAVASLCWAQEPAEVHYSGDLVLRIRTSIGDNTPQQRAVCIRQHLVEAINAVYATESEIFDPATVAVKKSPKGTPCSYQVWAGSVLIVGITAADAKANGCCTKQLAEKWQKNIIKALAKATHDC